MVISILAWRQGARNLGYMVGNPAAESVAPAAGRIGPATRLPAAPLGWGRSGEYEVWL